MIYYCFLIKRAHDSRSWPVIYSNRALADDSPFRVSPVTEVYLDENCKCPPVPARHLHFFPGCPYSPQEPSG
jgi:hypothetical protein